MRNAAMFVSVFVLGYLMTLFWGHVGALQDKEAMSDLVSQCSARGCIENVNEDHGWYRESVDLEEYTRNELMKYVRQPLHPEAMKALAVVMRTELQNTDGALKPVRVMGIGSSEEDAYKSAVDETKGIFLKYQGAPAHALWCYLSNGSTRDGQENHLANSPYLKTYICREDIVSPKFKSEVILSKEKYFAMLMEMFELSGRDLEPLLDDFGWPILEQIRDSAGYTRTVNLGPYQMEGGAFADSFHLASPCFDIEVGDSCVLLCAVGVGHGFGMSLWEADRMAQNGATFMDILDAFYPGTELSK